MNYKNIIKKQSFIITASIIVMALILLGSSYALFTNVNNSSQQVVSSGTLQISYEGSAITTVGGTDGSGNLVEIEPLAESDVTAQDPYKIVVSNTGTLAMSYNIIIYTDTTNTLPHSYLSLKIKENGSYGETISLTSLPKVDDTKTALNEIKYKLTSTPFTIEPNASATHELYLWLDEAKSDEDISDKIANVKIVVEGEAATPSE